MLLSLPSTSITVSVASSATVAVSSTASGRRCSAHTEIGRFRVEGHTDDRGNDAFNRDLSQRRADAAVAYLVDKGVPVERLEAVGFGEDAPLQSNRTPKGRAANRRVVFVIIGGDGSVEVQQTPHTGTRIDEIDDGIYRIHTPVREAPGGFSFNQYLIVDDQALLFHTGPRRMFPLVRDAIAAVIPPATLRWIGFCHVEADECGGLNDLLTLAPQAEPLCSRLAAMVSVDDLADRAPRALGDGESLRTGRRTFTWIDAPHVPHGWENGYLYESTS